MINPKIIYIAVVLIFTYIVAKFKIIPYLAARKILKDAKKNGKAAPDTAGTVQPSGTAPLFSPQTAQAMQAMQSAFPIGMLTPSATSSPSSGGRYREMYFDCETIDTRSGDLPDSEDASAPPDPVKDCEVVAARVNSFLLRLRNRGIYPDTLGIIPIADRVFMAYVIYTA